MQIGALQEFLVQGKNCPWHVLNQHASCLVSEHVNAPDLCLALLSEQMKCFCPGFLCLQLLSCASARYRPQKYTSQVYEIDLDRLKTCGEAWKSIKSREFWMRVFCGLAVRCWCLLRLVFLPRRDCRQRHEPSSHRDVKHGKPQQPSVLKTLKCLIR